MRIQTFITGCALVLALFMFAGRHNQLPPEAVFRSVVDLTQPLGEHSPNWEGTDESPFQARQLGNIGKHGYYSRHISLPEHFSTHIDAPAHFAAQGWTVDRIPVENLVAPLVLIDVVQKASQNSDYEVSMDDVARWEDAHGPIPARAVVLARTGWAARWSSMKSYRNADAKGVPHYPGFALAAVKFLVESRQIVGLGIDTMGVDYGMTDVHPVHQFTSQNNVYHVENLADMSLVPESGAILMVGAAKLEGGSGGPVRVLALIK